jgi:hypothetical protein
LCSNRSQFSYRNQSQSAIVAVPMQGDADVGQWVLGVPSVCRGQMVKDLRNGGIVFSGHEKTPVCGDKKPRTNRRGVG